MSDETTNDQTTEEEPDLKTPEGLREAKKRAEKRARDEAERANIAETRLMEMAIKSAGISDPTTGIGKAVVMTYDGEPDPDAIREYAEKEFGFKPTAQAEAEPIAEQVEEAQQRVETVTASSTPVEPSDLDAQILEAEKRGDVQASMSLKFAKVVAASNQR